jgi:hypothetical protein
MKTADRIHKRAYEIWEREGRPEGQHDAHWEQARRECEAEDAPEPPKAPAVKATPKPEKEAAADAAAPEAKAPKPAKAAAKPAARRGKKGSAAD